MRHISIDGFGFAGSNQCLLMKERLDCIGEAIYVDAICLLGLLGLLVAFGFNSMVLGPTTIIFF